MLEEYLRSLSWDELALYPQPHPALPVLMRIWFPVGKANVAQEGRDLRRSLRQTFSMLLFRNSAYCR
jgi:hypothetical protein